MQIPTNSFSLMHKIYCNILPTVQKELNHWRKMAEKIPNTELRKQALESIKHKDFHCEGGAILALLAGKHYKECIKFIVAYQTISDYLDNLCDRSTSQDPNDFAALHEAMPDALTLKNKKTTTQYYQYRTDQNDGGYLIELVQTCQNTLKNTKHHSLIYDKILTLAKIYCELQIHKHVVITERKTRLKNWFCENKLNDMQWFEFCACAGSTLGIFCLVAYSFNEVLTKKEVLALYNGYFPYIQGLHILLDYLIDQDEDLIGGDLNFCTYYSTKKELTKRLQYFIKMAKKSAATLPDHKFHLLITTGLIGIYTSDNKCNLQKETKKITKKLIKTAGFTARFFYINARSYRVTKHFANHFIKRQRF